ncbi:hypothetical protein EVAR_47836_1 [Eumeta japonica]|uniref:Uncharacterized protein n=1 Tax=Eumeta variegata TaxID=151549 RepID=A0A4C1XTY7_EUMVA|nr:hypothetical protein EVAR_47836_1 [Eumeta japonica]
MSDVKSVAQSLVFPIVVLDLDIAAAEGVWAYHTIQENHSFRSNDCASKLIQSCFDPKFACAYKTEAIVVNVLARTAIDNLKDDLNKSNCITILNDASNHGNKKIYPFVVRFFQPYEGVQVKILDLQEQPGETSDIIVDYLQQVLTDNNLTKKVVAFCGDNTNVNFGGVARRGTNNVLAKLQSSLKKPLIGIGCGAHIIHNAIKSAADGLPLDYESIIVKIYSFFYIYTVRVEALKEFCAEAEIEHHQMLGYSKTRWLALMPALERVLKMYQPLKDYFLSIEKCPKLLKDFFEDPTSELWLYFLHAQSASFHHAVLKVEAFWKLKTDRRLMTPQRNIADGEKVNGKGLSLVGNPKLFILEFVGTLIVAVFQRWTNRMPGAGRPGPPVFGGRGSNASAFP